MTTKNDPTLRAIANLLKTQYDCHTAILYGSRASGQVTATSDYDVIGIRSVGLKTRIAKKDNGAYWDIFIYPEEDLRNLSKKQLDWTDAKVLYEKGNFGHDLIRQLRKYSKKFFEPLPTYELQALKVWAQKQLERCQVTDIYGLYRRVEFLYASVEHYFLIRRKRFLGPKNALKWIKKNDPSTFHLFEQVFKKNHDLKILKSLAKRVYKLK